VPFDLGRARFHAEIKAERRRKDQAELRGQ